MFDAVTRFIDRLRPTPRFEAEMDAEIRHHIEAHTDRLIAGGMEPKAAARKARLDFGAREHYRDEVRQTRWLWFLEELARDVRFGIRSLRRAPGLTATIILTLALGIGANTAIFSVVNGVMFRPLPFKDPDRLVNLFQYGPSYTFDTRNDREPLLPQVNFYAQRDRLQSFEDVGAFWSARFRMIDVDRPKEVYSAFVSPNFCELLGIRPQIGRCINEEDEQQGAFVAMLRHDLWRNQFGGGTDVLGKTIRLRALGKNYDATVIGVLPREFDIDLDYEMILRGSDSDRGPNMEVGRLRAGVTPEQAHAEMLALEKTLRPTQYEGHGGFTMLVLPVMENVELRFGEQFLLLMGAVSLLLLIACANVANLLLSRGSARMRELSVRAAVGAGRRRIIRQLLTESVLLASAGGLAGLLTAMVGVRWIVAELGDLPRVESIGVDWRVLVYTACVSIGGGLLLGLIPALRLSHTDLSVVMKSAGKGSAGGRKQQRWMSGLLAAQAALCLVATIGAGLLMNTMIRLRGVDLGFDPQGVVTVQLDTEGEPPQERAFLDEVLDRVRSLPGVQGAVVADEPPTALRYGWPVEFRRLGTSDAFGPGSPRGYPAHVSSGYFDTLGSPLLYGRDFAPGTVGRDLGGAQPVIISESLAERYWGGAAAVGQTIVMPPVGDGEETLGEIIGVAGDSQYLSVRENSKELLYFPFPVASGYTPNLLVRGTGSEEALLAAVTAAIREIDPNQSFVIAQSLASFIDDRFAKERQLMTLLSWFAGLALILTAVGVAGQVAYAVGRRKQEIAIRVSCGARPGTILRLFLAASLLPVLAGVGIGAIGALAVTTYAESLLFEITPSDPETFLIAAVVLMTIALTASLIASSRATHIDQAQVLRQE